MGAIANLLVLVVSLESRLARIRPHQPARTVTSLLG
jgi:hypothetical protein